MVHSIQYGPTLYQARFYEGSHYGIFSVELLSPDGEDLDEAPDGLEVAMGGRHQGVGAYYLDYSDGLLAIDLDFFMSNPDSRDILSEGALEALAEYESAE